MKMPVGRYKGWQLRDVPVTYLRWLVKQPGVRLELRGAIMAQLGIKPKRGDVLRGHHIAPIDYKAAAAGPDR